MKRLLCLFLAGSMFLAAQSQTVEEVLTKYEAAAGGKDRLQAIKTLEVFSNVKISVMNQNIDLPVTTIKEKGKLSRRQVGGIMGMGDSYTLITDTAGYIYVPAMRGFGMDGGTPPVVTQLKPEELAAQQHELDCAGPFPELVNTGAKGHTAELAGNEKVNKVPSYKIKLTLKNGQQIFYYINSETFLVNRVEAFGDMAANLTGFGSMMKAFGRNIGKNMKGTVDILEYQDFGGIKYPLKTKMTLASLSSDVENTTIRFNEGVDEKWYKVK